MPDNATETAVDALHRGMQRARAYDWEPSVEAFRKAVALDPENVEARFRLGWALWNLAEVGKPSLANVAVVMGAQAFGFEQTARDARRKFQTYRQLLNDCIHYLTSVLERDPKPRPRLPLPGACLSGTGPEDGSGGGGPQGEATRPRQLRLLGSGAIALARLGDAQSSACQRVQRPRALARHDLGRSGPQPENQTGIAPDAAYAGKA